jgi:predicted nucleotide-binding protein
MKKLKEYGCTLFSSEVIREISNRVIMTAKKDRKLKGDEPIYSLRVKLRDEEWSYDNVEEFFADYRKYPHYAHYSFLLSQIEFSLITHEINTSIRISGNNREDIEKIFNEIEKHVDSSKIPERRGAKRTKDKPVVFIGHGGSGLWRDLKDHLQDKHGYKIEAYEIGSRAGHGIRDILEDMMEKSSVAFLVMTGEDQTTEGGLRARQNVIHETGLFQGRLGFSKAIVLMEEGTEEFSNLHGIQQIRFSKGNIRETFGDVVATIKREFS